MDTASQTVDRQQMARSTPLPGILALLCGLGLLLADWKFGLAPDSWSVEQHFVFLAAAAALTFWGVQQTFAGARQATTTAKRRLRLNRRRVMLPREGMLYLLVMAVFFVGSLLGRSNMLMLVFALMAGPFVLNGWITFSLLKRIHVTRRMPRRAMAGEPISVEIQFENRKLLFSSWLMGVRDRIEGLREQLTGKLLFARVGPRSCRSASYQLQLTQRGRYTFGPIEVTTRFPMGLVERGVILESPGEILIYPRIGQIAARWKNQQLAAAELVQQRDLRKGAFDDEFHRIREYRWGDNPRAIHWRTSARRNELMVREYHQSRDQNLIVLLDLWLPERPSEADRQRAELAVSLTATTCVEFMRECRNLHLNLLLGGDGFSRWEGRPGIGAVDSILEMLAVAQAGPAPPLDQLLEECDRLRSPHTASLLITTRGETVESRLANFQRTGSLSGGKPEIPVIDAGSENLASFFELDPIPSRRTQHQSAEPGVAWNAPVEEIGSASPSGS